MPEPAVRNKKIFERIFSFCIITELVFPKIAKIMNIASIDIGSNTVLLLISEVNLREKTLKALRNEYRIPRLGGNLKRGESISSEKISELLSIIRQYREIIDSYNCSVILSVGTNALRIASNTKEIIEIIKQETGIVTEVISGDTEARYSYLGASAEYPHDCNTLVIDIGGGSTELTIGNGQKIHFSKSFQIGVVSLNDMFSHNISDAEILRKKMKEYSDSVFSEIFDKNIEIGRAISIGGTPTTLYTIINRLPVFNESEIHGNRVSKQELSVCTNELITLTPQEIIKKYPAVTRGREDVITAGAVIMESLLEGLKLGSFLVSTKGIRYGVVYDYIFRSTDKYSA